MTIERIINNNVVSAFDKNQREVVIMGRGIAYKKRPGDIVDEKKIEKTFILNNQDEVGKFSELLKLLPLEHLEVSSDIIDYAKQVMPRKLNPTIYITLTDHINFAIDRQKKGMMFQNALLHEVKSFYASEYLIGEYAVSYIKQNLGVSFPEDEAASIALHFVNAEYNTGMCNTMNITTMIKEIIDIVEEEMHTHLDEKGLYYSRFVTHLKFLAQRLFSGQMLDCQEQEFTEMICRMYPKEYDCSRKIEEYIEKKYSQKITDEELSYLAVHIRRIQPDIEE